MNHCARRSCWGFAVKFFREVSLRCFVRDRYFTHAHSINGYRAGVFQSGMLTKICGLIGDPVEVPKAFVVSDGTLTAEDVMAFVAEHVSPQKKVRRVEFVDAIPKSASGKILRRVLIDREIAAMEHTQ